MRRALWLGLAALAALCVGSTPASAQGVLRVDVPFAFVVGGRTMPAGSYQVTPQGQMELELRGSSGAPAVLTLVTRVAARPNASIPNELVFDKVGNQNILSEVWYEGEDGYVFAATKGPHTHTGVKASRKG
jgi:hypothetical protein